jgi:hypothetical protein
MKYFSAIIPISFFLGLIYSFNWSILNPVKPKQGDRHQWTVALNASERKIAAEKYRYATPVNSRNHAAIALTMTVQKSTEHPGWYRMTDTVIQEKSHQHQRKLATLIFLNRRIQAAMTMLGTFWNSCLTSTITRQNSYQRLSTTHNAHQHPP